MQNPTNYWYRSANKAIVCTPNEFLARTRMRKSRQDSVVKWTLPANKVKKFRPKFA